MLLALRRFCCCEPDEDDEVPIIDESEEPSIPVSQDGPIEQLWSMDELQFGRTPERGTPLDEQEMINQILESTQQNIIDVSNIDNPSNIGADSAAKSRLYQQLIERHDAAIRSSSIQNISNTTQSSRQYLLVDAKEKMIGYMHRSPSPSLIAEVTEFAENFALSMKAIKVKHIQNVVVYM